MADLERLDQNDIDEIRAKRLGGHETVEMLIRKVEDLRLLVDSGICPDCGLAMTCGCDET